MGVPAGDREGRGCWGSPPRAREKGGGLSGEPSCVPHGCVHKGAPLVALGGRCYYSHFSDGQTEARGCEPCEAIADPVPLDPSSEP